MTEQDGVARLVERVPSNVRSQIRAQGMSPGRMERSYVAMSAPWRLPSWNRPQEVDNVHFLS